MSVLNRVPALRWAVPLAAALTLMGGATAVGGLSASADADLPARSAAQLLVDVQQAQLKGLSGTVESKADLGLTDLPGTSGSKSSDLSSLASGKHTLRVAYAGPDKSRLAVLGTLGESDVIQNGQDLWLWSSRDNTVTHRTLTADQRDQAGKKAEAGKKTEMPRTPQQAADAAIAALTPSTEVSATDNATVAGRPAYELVLTPKDTSSLVAQVRIAIDGVKHVPVRVEVLSTTSSEPAFQVGFTSVDFTTPADSEFNFTPPPGAKVTEAKPAGKDQAGKDAGSDTKVVGEGWASVVVQSVPKAATGKQESGDITRMVQALPKVSGDWGSGRLLAGKLFSVLVTDDGKIVVGAVKPEALYKALAAR